MPEEKTEVEKKEPTPEQVAEQTAAELTSLKEKFGKVVFTVNGKEHQLNLLDEKDFEKGQQFLAGGATFAQDRAKLNEERTALDAKVAEIAKATEEAKREQPKDAAGEAVDVEKLIADNPDLAKAIEEGDPAAFKKGLTAVLKEVAKPRKSEPAEAVGATKEEVAAETHASEARVIFNMKVRTDPRYIVLTKKLAEVTDCTELEAEGLIAAKKGDLDASDPVAVSGWLDKVVGGWVTRLGLKVESGPGDGSGTGKEEAPDGSRQTGGGPGGSEQPKFKDEIEMQAYVEKQRKENKRKGKWSP